MAFKEFIQRLGEKQKARQAMLKEMEQDVRFQKIVQDRMKSANERELERYINENREKQIKTQLEFARKQRQNEINFGHNPLNTPNITNKTQWEVMKEKNQFANNKNMFANQKSVLKSNRNLLKNNKKMFSGRCTI